MREVFKFECSLLCHQSTGNSANGDYSKHIRLGNSDNKNERQSFVHPMSVLGVGRAYLCSSTWWNKVTGSLISESWWEAASIADSLWNTVSCVSDGRKII